MPRGRSTFTKRQKEQKRQQKQRDKAERRVLRKQDKPEGGLDRTVDSADELRELREHAAAQAALFNIGAEEASADESGDEPQKDPRPSGAWTGHSPD